MICLRCNNDTFTEAPNAVIEQEFKGEMLKVQTPALTCAKCGWITLDPGHADELRRRTADAYRRKHGLLTSDAIKALRQLLEMNQREFAAFLGVGEASVKRWETWLVQEKSSDELIRLKCRDELTDKLPAAAWFCAHVTIDEAPNHFTVQKPVLRWSVQIDIAEQGDELNSSLSTTNEPSVCGLPPPRCEEVAFSLSVPFHRRTLKKKMLPNVSLTK